MATLAFLTVSNLTLVLTRGQEEIQPSVLQAFLGLANVYSRGGQSPDLVARLNAAIGLAEQGKIEREEGNLTGAASLENQADAEAAYVLSQIPAAQQNADHVSSIRTMTAIALVPISVIVSTFALYLVLRTWKAYERRRLYEMRIVEKTEDY